MQLNQYLPVFEDNNGLIVGNVCDLCSLYSFTSKMDLGSENRFLARSRNINKDIAFELQYSSTIFEL